jgi:protein-disulfide isomerase
MSHLVASYSQNRPFSNRAGLILSLALAALLSTASTAIYAQFSTPAAGIKVLDPSALRPPAGARVAIVEFADMQCPACAAANPVLKQAVAHYKIPWMRHDFIIPGHPWSPYAAINARWFDSKSKALGEEYRDQVFANQASFYYNVALFNQFTEKFAKSHGIILPFAIDPQGSLAAAVKADTELGKRTGINITPSIWVVTANSKGAPFIEVRDRSKLYQIIDQALSDTASAAKPAVKKVVSK